MTSEHGVISRRDRVRAATETEILTTARQLLVEGGLPAVSLREVARRMGMTASALYRYLDNHEDLIDRLAAVLLAELTAAVEASLARFGPGDDPVESLSAAGRAFRSWGVANPAEFGLLFGPRPPGLAKTEEGREHDAGHRFGVMFGERLLSAMGAAAARAATPPDPEATLAAMPAALGTFYVRGWIRLLGTVSTEVFGHLTWTGRPGEEIFEDELADVAERLRAALASMPRS